MQNNMMALLSMISQCKGNPQVLINQMLKQNPQAKAIINQMQQSGMTPEQFARQLAKQNNVDIDGMKSTMNNMGIKF